MTTRHLRRTVTVGAVALAALLTTACGGSGSTANTSSSSSSAAGSGSSSASSSTSAAADGGSTAAFCAEVASQKQTLAGTQLSKLLAGGSPAAWKAYLAAADAMNAKLTDAAPADIKPSVEAIRAHSQALATAIAAADYDLSKLGDAGVLKIIQDGSYQKATTALVKYVATNCKIDLTKVS